MIGAATLAEYSGAGGGRNRRESETLGSTTETADKGGWVDRELVSFRESLSGRFLPLGLWVVSLKTFRPLFAVKSLSLLIIHFGRFWCTRLGVDCYILRVTLHCAYLFLTLVARFLAVSIEVRGIHSSWHWPCILASG